MFSCPPSITKTKIWRIGIRIFGGSDVVNKLHEVMSLNSYHLGLSELGRAGPWSPQISTDQYTLSQPGGQVIPTSLLTLTKTEIIYTKNVRAKVSMDFT